MLFKIRHQFMSIPFGFLIFNHTVISKDLVSVVQFFDKKEYESAFNILDKYVHYHVKENEYESFNILMSQIKYYLGYLYYYGLGTQKNHDLALRKYHSVYV